MTEELIAEMRPIVDELIDVSKKLQASPAAALSAGFSVLMVCLQGAYSKKACHDFYLRMRELAKTAPVPVLESEDDDQCATNLIAEHLNSFCVGRGSEAVQAVMHNWIEQILGAAVGPWARDEWEKMTAEWARDHEHDALPHTRPPSGGPPRHGCGGELIPAGNGRVCAKCFAAIGDVAVSTVVN